MGDKLYTCFVKLSTIKVKAVEKDTSFGESKSCFRPSAGIIALTEYCATNHTGL